jgi:hypothetical protein
LDAAKVNLRFHFAALGIVLFALGVFSLLDGKNGLNGLLAIAMAIALQPLARTTARFLTSTFVDEVTDLDDHLVVRLGLSSTVLSLSRIQSVSFKGLVDPPRIVLTLKEPSELGATITFQPIGNGRLSNPIADELRERIRNAVGQDGQ